MARTRLVRPKQGRLIAGVCAALADRFGVSRTLVRVIFVLLGILPPPIIIVYLLLWIVIPSEE
jgi:phage shock protein PspC (stress-responsive transcriptional regulator)